LTKYHLDKIGVFGSILHSDNPNDIDLFIENFRDYSDLIGLKNEIETKTGKSVDVVIEKYASPIIVYRAKKELKYVA
jgi:predicted nucleotidyltransferase